MIENPRVFIPQWPMHRATNGERRRLDLSPARAFGELVEVVEFNGAMEPPVRKLREALGDFSDDDFILLAGNPTMMIAVATIALEVNDGRARFLQWFPAQKAYQEWTIDAAFWDVVNSN